MDDILYKLAAKAWEVKDAIEQSSHLYNSPDSLLGYGIPDFKLAWEYLDEIVSTRENPGKKWFVYPNPAYNYVILEKISGPSSGIVEIDVYTLDGRLLRKWEKPAADQIVLYEIQTLPAGLLILRISSGTGSETAKLSKFR